MNSKLFDKEYAAWLKSANAMNGTANDGSDLEADWGDSREFGEE